MESRGVDDLQGTKRGPLVAAITYELPLLPYERQLIEILGISEQEYRKFAAEIASKGHRRPAGYEHIPDIRCDPITTTILVSLAIGLVTTGISMLLAPKPVEPDEEDPATSKNFGDQKGRTRFNTSVGFDGAPQLAMLGSRIPILFGKYEANNPDGGEDGEIGSFNPTGGILVEPLLVWSRMLSYGSYQVMKAVFTIGEAEINQSPDLQGILIGGQPIANIYRSNYAFYWKSDRGDNRLYQSDLEYGDAAPGNNAAGGIFTCPTLSGVLEPGFSMASSPANTTSFGVYSALPNGGRISVNWRVVSILKQDGDDDPEDRLQNERKKIAGSKADGGKDGMPGEGRWYSRKCGVMAVNGAEYSLPTEVEINRGDTITYRISGGSLVGKCDLDKKSGVSMADLNNTINSIRERADALLNVGEIFQINRALFRVINRPDDVWIPGAYFHYELKCIDFTGSNRVIGICGTKNIGAEVLAEGDGHAHEYARGSSWYAMTKVDLGQVRNTRACEVTELGIKSQVWQQAQGLCNFNNVPFPNELVKYDQEKVNISAGSMSKYMKRTSFFVLGVKDVRNPQGVEGRQRDETSDNDGLFDGFDILDGLTFAIQGSTPVDVFNYIRIEHPAKAEYEFRLIPKPSQNIIRFLDAQVPNVWLLDTTGPQVTQSIGTTHYGTFNVFFNGIVKPLQSLFELEEVTQGDEDDYWANYKRLSCAVNTLSWQGAAGGPQGGGVQQAFMETIFGPLKPNSGSSSKAVYGETRNGYFYIIEGGVTFRVNSRATVMFGGEAMLHKNGTAKYWSAYYWQVAESSGEIREGDVFVKLRGQSVTQGWPIQNTWYGNYFHLTSATVAFKATGVVCVDDPSAPPPAGARNFDMKAQIKEESAWSEVRHSCDDGPEHEIVYINESQDTVNIANYYDMSCVGLKLKSLNRISSFQQMQIWLANGISVHNLIDGTFGPSNNFADLLWWILETPGNSIGGELSSRLLDKESFVHTAKFLRNYWMRFDGAIADRVNVRAWATQMAPLFLCNFVIANGKFALVPALPVDSSGQIITSAVPISMYFNDGNIINGTFELDYLPQTERQDFRAVMKYRDSEPNSLVELESVMVKWKGEGIIPPNQEDYDMSPFCSRRSHALAAARYLLSVRRRVDHVVRFSTVPTGLSLRPGDYIRLDTAASPYQSLYNAAVRDNLSILSAEPPPNGSHAAYVYRAGAEGTTEEIVEITNGAVVDPTLAGALLNIPNPIPRRFGVYLVEEIALSEEGLVDIVGSHFPVYEDMSSKIVHDVLDTDVDGSSRFEIIE